MNYNQQKGVALYFREALEKYRPLFVFVVLLPHEQSRARRVMKVLMYLSSFLLTIQYFFFVINITAFHWWKDRSVSFSHLPYTQRDPERLFSPIWLLGFLISLSLLVFIALFIAHCTSLTQYNSLYLIHFQRCVFVSSKFEPYYPTYDP